ncbi:hypothetical protein COBT_001492 [Conglomerata obtusa]
MFGNKAEYRYYMFEHRNEVLYSLSNNDEPISDEMIHQHNKFVQIIQNYKSLLKRSFLENNMHFLLKISMKKNNLHAYNCQALQLQKVSILWNYKETETSIKTIIDIIRKSYRVDTEFGLYKYQYNFNDFNKDVENKGIKIFQYIGRMYKTSNLSDEDNSNKIYKNRNLCLKIFLDIDDTFQSFYIFLPVYDFQSALHKDLKNAVYIFNKLLRMSIEVFENKNAVISRDLYISIVDEIAKINNLLLEIYWLNLKDYDSNEKLKILIYLIIAIKAKEYKSLKGVHDGLTCLDQRLLDKIKIPLDYDAFIVKNTCLYEKIIQIECLNEIYCTLNIIIRNCLEIAAEALPVELENKRQYCYIQCGKEFTAYEIVEKIIKSLEN